MMVGAWEVVTKAAVGEPALDVVGQSHGCFGNRTASIPVFFGA